MKKTAKFLTIAIVLAIVLSVLAGCIPARNPENYYVNDSTNLPEELKQGSYNLTSLIYHNATKGDKGGKYFLSVKDTEVIIRNELFVMGKTRCENPKYHELQFYGIFRAVGSKNDRYRPVEPEDIGNADRDESGREIKRCIAVFDSDDRDTGFRIYIMDDEVWLAYFIEDGDAPWMCDDLFTIKYDRIGSLNPDKEN